MTEMHSENILKAAERLWIAQENMSPCEPIRDLISTSDLDGAYQVQKINIDRGTAKGARISGRKIGFTSTALRTQLGVSEPDFGTLFTSMEIDHGGEISLAGCLDPRVEMEIGLVFGDDLDGEHISRAKLIRSVEYVTASLEIVESRISDWDVTIVDNIADNGAAGRYVFGSRVVPIAGLELADCKAELHRNGEAIGFGTGAASMGHPLNAALWLARDLAGRGEPLQCGDFVLTGALSAMVPPRAGDRFTANIEGLGTATVHFI